MLIGSSRWSLEIEWSDSRCFEARGSVGLGCNSFFDRGAVGDQGGYDMCSPYIQQSILCGDSVDRIEIRLVINF